MSTSTHFKARFSVTYFLQLIVQPLVQSSPFIFESINESDDVKTVMDQSHLNVCLYQLEAMSSTKEPLGIL